MPAIGLSYTPGVGAHFDPQLAAQQQHQNERMKEMAAAEAHENLHGKEAKPTALKAGGKVWVDPSLNEWNPNDFRLFVGNLGPDCNDEVLNNAFSHYASLTKTKLVRAQGGKKSGYGFASFSDGKDYLHALDKMNGKFVGNRPITVTKSKWKDRLATGKDKRKAYQKLPASSKRTKSGATQE